MEKQGNALLEMAQRIQVYAAHGRSISIMDSVSFADARDAGQIIVTGSHGGRSAGEYAARIMPLVSVCSDAGIGKNGAGVAGLKELDAFGVIGLGVSHLSARIGDGMDIWENGVVSYVNDCGKLAGMSPGARLGEVLRTFLDGNPAGLARPVGASRQKSSPMERRILAENMGRRLVAMDSISIIHDEDRDQIVIAGSNGGLASGELTLRVRPALVALNDAGIGKDRAGIAGLIQIDQAAIPGVGISHDTAEISSGADMWINGIVSFVNESARRLGVEAGMTLPAVIMGRLTS
ncbi:hypothetical protein [Chelatococcus asaccharovorans]|uniref:Uncharacterized protein n=1 Tax=Chelatococcus asaccharovorans TaxID=28210 RepID=A0A2V3TW26_9HYPH|nr:hypothetical protein [Chelatococcus asaccharovorans]MBS7706168.1 hypothetical protein [Chelatococcus asaccharovorans]PXW52544.1 hypothetical protein C7450_116118 [Chelatococcus asaccharovorans]